MMPPGAEAVWAALPEARIVGGAVRDRLAGRPATDIDFASPLPPQAAMARLNAAGIETVPTGLAHGTITALARGHAYEITTLRRDLATDGRHATVAFTEDWREDAARRDFTINAMSMSRDGAISDDFGGREDLAAGRIVFVGDPAARIAEDYLRILRFFRFFAWFGRTAPEPATLAALAAHASGLARLPAERIWAEWKRLLAAPDIRPAVALMARTGVLPLVAPAADPARLDPLARHGAPADPLLRLAALLPHDADTATSPPLSRSELDRLAALRGAPSLPPDADDETLRRALANEPADLVAARTWLAQDERPGWPDLRARLAAMPRPVFPLRGRDLLAAGVAPGPELGRRLAALRHWWWQTGCTADAAACLARL